MSSIEHAPTLLHYSLWEQGGETQIILGVHGNSSVPSPLTSQT